MTYFFTAVVVSELRVYIAFFGPVGIFVGLSASLFALVGVAIGLGATLPFGVDPPPYSNDASKFYFC